MGSGVEIKDSSVVERGSLIGDKVIIGPGAKLKPFDRLSVPWAAASGDDDDEDEASDIEDAEKGMCSPS